MPGQEDIEVTCDLITGELNASYDSEAGGLANFFLFPLLLPSSDKIGGCIWFEPVL